MTSSDVKRLAKVLAIWAEIEGMKAENQLSKFNNSCAYGEKAFIKKADELRTLANELDEALPELP